MTISVYDIISANSVFTKILQHEFTAKQSFIIGRILKTLNSETENFNKIREEALSKYAVYDSLGEMVVENGNVKIKDGEMKNFQQEINELLYANIDINVSPIPLKWLDDLKLTPQETLALEPFVLVDEE